MQEAQTDFIETHRAEYQKIGRVFCPYLGKEVDCNSSGFNHLIYKSDRTRRTEIELETKKPPNKI